MKYSLIIRDAILPEDPTYKAISELQPDFLTLSLDIGGRLVRNFDDLVRRRNHNPQTAKQALWESTGEKLNSIGKHPFVNKSVRDFNVFMPSAAMNYLKSKEYRNEVIGSIFSMYASVHTVYIDLGMSPVENGLAEACNDLFKFMDSRKVVSNNGQVLTRTGKIGLVAPMETWLDKDGWLRKYAEDHERIIPCPYLAKGMIRPQLEKVQFEFLGNSHVFISLIEEKDRIDFSKVVYDVNINSFVFWSPFSLDDFSFRQKNNMRKMIEDQSRATWKSLREITVRKSPTLNARPVGMIKEGERVELSPAFVEDNVGYAEVWRSGTKIGFVITSQMGEDYFEKENKSL